MSMKADAAKRLTYLVENKLVNPKHELEFRSGDMFKTPATIRVNTVNCVGVMGTGVALEFKTRYPKMFEEYRKDCKLGLYTPGVIKYWETPLGNRIANFPTKIDWKNDSDYEWIASGLKTLRNDLMELPDETVVMPPLGCGNGNLDWKIVKLLIEAYLAEVPCNVIVFAPNQRS